MLLFIYFKSLRLLALQENQGIVNSYPRQSCAAIMSTEHDIEVKESPSEAAGSRQMSICSEAQEDEAAAAACRCTYFMSNM